MTDNEIHIFIIWEKGRHSSDKIIDEIGKRFRIIELLEVNWSENQFASNLTRFYGEKLPPKSHKEKHCGKGPFLLIIVEDLNPIYEFRSTNIGMALVNVNLFDQKNYYRKLTGGGHLIHATNDEEESNHDLMLLLGKPINDYKTEKVVWDQKIKPFKNDLIGANGWQSMSQLFQVFNNTLEYVVLRNFEDLLNMDLNKKDIDIDLLVNDYNEIKYIANSTEVFKDSNRVQNYIKIDGKDIQFDFRYLGDGYYDSVWEKNILEKRVFRNDIYVPSSNEHFYSLLYHALIHKKAFPQKYFPKLEKTSQDETELEKSIVLSQNVDRMYQTLIKYMDKRFYKLTVPKDPSIQLNKKYVRNEFFRAKVLVHKLKLFLTKLIK